MVGKFTEQSFETSVNSIVVYRLLGPQLTDVHAELHRERCPKTPPRWVRARPWWGRSPECGLVIDDVSIWKRHVVLEVAGRAMRPPGVFEG